jgi:hypothetical protein
MKLLPAGYAIGYSPTQIVHANARDSFYWDEEAAIHRLITEHPLCDSIMKLARAKILQALVDIGYQGQKPGLVAERNRAWAWVFSDRSDFRAFCSDACYSPIIVRHKAREVAESGLQWRAEAGTGKRYDPARRRSA